MVQEARLVELASGLAPAAEGWFVVNARDAAWETGPFGAACFFESEAAPFAELGVNLRVLWPGRSRWLYPRSELALRHGVGVERETGEPGEALAGLPEWQLARPDRWSELPWALPVSDAAAGRRPDRE